MVGGRLESTPHYLSTVADAARNGMAAGEGGTLEEKATRDRGGGSHSQEVGK